MDAATYKNDFMSPGSWLHNQAYFVSIPQVLFLASMHLLVPSYENLNKRNIQTLVDLVRDSNPRLRDFLPRCEQGIKRMLGGKGIDNGFIKEFESYFSG